jgi:hypothetical protein
LLAFGEEEAGVSTAGQILAGKYRLTSELGKGGMGSVWSAEHLILHCQVALKLIEPTRSSGEDGAAHFLREARMAAGLNSQHVVKIFDYGLSDSKPFIAMELLDGETLRQRLQRVGCLGLGETQRVVRQAAFGVERAHQAGIVHRDLKPENIFIVSSDEAELVKVLDFGIAKSMASSLLDTIPAVTPTGAVLGTPQYMSPEQAMGQRDLDHRTDVWSLGVLTFEALLGQAPFRGDTLGALIVAICSKPPPVPSELGPVPDGFDAWFLRACARDPRERFESVRQLADAFLQLRANDTRGTPPRASLHGPSAAQVDRAPVITATAEYTAASGRSGFAATEVVALGAKSVAEPEPDVREATGAPFEHTMPAAVGSPEVGARVRSSALRLSLVLLVAALCSALVLRFWKRGVEQSTVPDSPASTASPRPAAEANPSRAATPPPPLPPPVSRPALDSTPSHAVSPPPSSDDGVALQPAPHPARAAAEASPPRNTKPSQPPEVISKNPRVQRGPTAPEPKSDPDDPYHLGF